MLHKISILIPVYNTAVYLEKCLNSILQQTYPNLEIIAVNDGSTDNSGEILDRYAAKHSNLKVIHQQNSGHQIARQTGIENATGEYIAFVDSDDSLPSADIFKQLAQAITPKIDIVVGRINIDNGTTQKLFPSDIFDTIKASDYMTKYLLCGRVGWNLCAKLFRANLIKQTDGHPISVTAGEDALYTISVANAASGDVTMVNIPVYNYSVRPDSITHTYNVKYIYDNFAVASYIDTLLKDKVEPKHLIAFRLLCMSASFKYGWLGSKHPLNADAIACYKKTRGVLPLYLRKKRLKIWLLVNFGDWLSRFIFKNSVDEK